MAEPDAPLRVLLVEDDDALADFLLRVFAEEGFDAVRCTTGAEALERIDQDEHTVVVLDRMLPDQDGITVCSEIRRQGLGTAILMLTARGEVADRVGGLNAGADDYLVKPFDVDELLARIRALRRRTGASVTTIGPLRFDWRQRAASIAGARLDLTSREFDLLAHLAGQPDRPAGRAELLEVVWQTRFDPGTNVIEVYINRLRNKLGEHATMLETVKGSGYRLRGTPR